MKGMQISEKLLDIAGSIGGRVVRQYIGAVQLNHFYSVVNP